MKKLYIVIAGLMFSGAASAVQFGATGTLNRVDCQNLNEDVRINLTAGVVAGANCRFGSTNPAQPDRVAIAACHSAGMQKSRSITQKTIAAVPPATQPTIVTGCTVGTSDPTCAVVQATGAAVPSATTLAGTVNIEYPGSGACTAGVAETVAGTL
jgi:hypothetical protein